MDESCVISDENYLTRAYKCGPGYIPLNITKNDPNPVTLGKFLRQYFYFVRYVHTITSKSHLNA